MNFSGHDDSTINIVLELLLLLSTSCPITSGQANLIFAIFWVLVTHFNIFSPLQSQMIIAHIWNKIRHFTLITLCAKLRRSVL